MEPVRRRYGSGEASGAVSGAHGCPSKRGPHGVSFPSRRPQVVSVGLGLRTPGMWWVCLVRLVLAAGLAGLKVAAGDDGAGIQAVCERRYVHVHRVLLVGSASNVADLALVFALPDSFDVSVPFPSTCVR